MSVDLDRQLQEYCRLMDESQRSLSLDDILDRSGEVQVLPNRRVSQFRSRRRWSTVAGPGLAVVAVVAALVLGLGAVPLIRDRAPVASDWVPSNGWIAFSTQPGFSQVSETDLLGGGNIYLVRGGVEPMLIVSRGDPAATNVCPAFSPDGSMLAYGELADSIRTLVVLAVAADGSVTEVTRIEVPGLGAAPCPSWSSDGTRLAYLQRELVPDAFLPAGTVVVRGLDGSTPEPGEGDPTFEVLTADLGEEGPAPLASPDGTLVTRSGFDVETYECHVIVSRPDGSESRTITSKCVYSVAAWSPDGRYILTMEDVGSGFTMVGWSIKVPFESVILASNVPTNGARSWPGRGDVSWQPVYSGS